MAPPPGPAPDDAQQPEEDAPELLPHQTVDDEVDGRIDRQQHVDDGVRRIDDGLVERHPARDQLRRGNRQPKADVRQFADDENADDADQHQGYVLPLPTAARRRPAAPRRRLEHPVVPEPHRPKRDDQAVVENGEQEQRSEGAEQEVAEGLVDEEVETVGGEAGPAQFGRRRPGAVVANVDDVAFEEVRDVVEEC